MTPNENQREEMLNRSLDQAADSIRNDIPTAAAADAAAASVWERLAEVHGSAPIRTCQEFQAMLPDFKSGKLTAARKLLLTDHLHECVHCRKVAEGRVTTMPARPAVRRDSPRYRWAIAAGLVLTAGLAAWNLRTWFGQGEGSPITVMAADGPVYRLSAEGARPVAAGESVPGGTEVRTADGAHAMVKLADGSVVEMKERTGLKALSKGKDLTVRMAGGAVIVEAAKRSAGHLFIAARDCKVAVTGTVFSVNSGTKGSRVSVIEGSVLVAQADFQRRLQPGEQYTTTQSVEQVPVAQEIAWSHNLSQHLALLKEVSDLRQHLQAVQLPGSRYSSRLLDRVPAGTVIYVAIPNLGPAIDQANGILQERLSSSPTLKEWWDRMNSGAHGPKISDLLAEIKRFSDYLGDEVVIAAQQQANGHVGSPVLMAELKRTGFADFARQHFEQFAPEGRKQSFAISRNVTELAGTAKGEMRILANDNLVAISPDGTALAGIGAEGSTGFVSTPFHARLQKVYSDGAGFLFSADLESLLAANPNRDTAHEPPGLRNFRDIVVEQTESNGVSTMQAVLSFKGQREGIPSWMAEPGPIRALDFLSPEASVVAAINMKTPSVAVDELFSYLKQHDPKFEEHLAEAEAKLGLNIKQDLAGPLGTELVLAVDGPPIPPSWKLIVEVYDPGRLQYSLQKMLEVANQEAAQHGQPGGTLSTEVVDGRTYYSLTSPKSPMAVVYTYVDTYLLAAPSRQLIDQAIATRNSQYTLPTSGSFTSLLPRDRNAGLSGVFYQNLGRVLKPMADGLTGSVDLTDEQRKLIQEMSANLKPMLIAAYAGNDTITFAANGNLLSLGADAMLNGGGPLAMMRMLQKGRTGTTQGTKPAPPAYR